MKKSVVYHPRPPRFSCPTVIFFYFLFWEKLVYAKVGIRSSSIPPKCWRKSSRKKVNKFHWALLPVRSVAHCMHMGAKHVAVDLQYRTSFLLPLSPHHGEKCQSFRGKLAYITIERVSTKNQKKKKWRRPTHGFLHLNLKSLVRQADERSCKLRSFRLGFFQGDQSGPLHDEKLPNLYSPVVFPSVLKHLSSDTVKGWSSSSWVAAYLGSTTSLSTSEKKKVTTFTLHWDAKTSFHLHTVAYDHARTNSVPSQGRRHLEFCRSVDCALAPRFLALVPVY